jgi:1-acyl-sn-glycerol-3-phosphate acyltransferase
VPEAGMKAPSLVVAGIGRNAVALDGPARVRAVALAILSGLLMLAGALALVPIGIVTLFRARRLYAAAAKLLSRAALWLHGIRVVLHGQEFPRRQSIFVSNHTSTLDVFVLIALGLPNCRFFLSGFLRKLPPIGIIGTMMGTFFTVPQDRPAERTRIFQRAARTLRRTGESVYLSPEGARVRSGAIGRFNKGAFHLATDLHVPLVPMYIRIPPQVDPGLGCFPMPGVVDVYVLPPIETSGWRLEDLVENKERVRGLFVRVHQVIACA